MRAISITFSALGSSKPKLLSLVPFDLANDRRLEPLRSLNLEHISPDALVRQEIQRHTHLGVAAENALKKQQPLSEALLVALLRKWFWARKPDAAFLLVGFPATLLQAKVLDEWLEARGEALDGVLCADLTALSSVAIHYRDQGLLLPLAA